MKRARKLEVEGHEMRGVCRSGLSDSGFERQAPEYDCTLSYCGFQECDECFGIGTKTHNGRQS